MKLNRSLAAAAALAVAVAPAALAKGKPEDPGSKGKGKAKPHNVVLKGVVVSSDATTVTVTVKKATKYGKSLVGTDAQFTLSKISAADSDANGVVDGLDLLAGDKVVVQAKLAKDSVAPYASRRVVDQTHPAADDEETETEAPAPTA